MKRQFLIQGKTTHNEELIYWFNVIVSVPGDVDGKRYRAYIKVR